MPVRPGADFSPRRKNDKDGPVSAAEVQSSRQRALSTEHQKMLRRLLAVIAPLLGVALTLASVFLLLRMTVQSELMEDPLWRNLAMLGTLIAGVMLLVGSVYVSTRITVLLFSASGRTNKSENGDKRQ